MPAATAPEELARQRDTIEAVTRAWEVAYALYAREVNAALLTKPGAPSLRATEPPDGLTWDTARTQLNFAVDRLKQFVPVSRDFVWLPSFLGIELLRAGDAQLRVELDHLAKLDARDTPDEDEKDSSDKEAKRFWRREVIEPMRRRADDIRCHLTRLLRECEAMGGSSPNSVLLVLDPRNNSAILEGARHSGLSAKGFTLLTEIVKANGRTLPGAELRKILHMQRVDRALKKNVPEQLRPVIDSSPGYEGGYRLRSLYIGRWSIKSP